MFSYVLSFNNALFLMEYLCNKTLGALADKILIYGAKFRMVYKQIQNLVL